MNIKKSLLTIALGALGGALTIGIHAWTSSGENQGSPQETPVQETHTHKDPHRKGNENSTQVSFTNLSSSPAPAGTIKNFKNAAKKSVDAVVHVMTKKVQEQGYPNSLRDLLYDRKPRKRKAISSGSGVIVTGDGYVVTNNHVVQDAAGIKVVMNDGRTFDAEITGTDPATDLALLKISTEEDLPQLNYGNSDKLQVGEWVLAVGNPFNLTSTVTAGIVSAKARNINLLRRRTREEIFPVESFIQTDAAVNPGNSGGALVDTKGRLVGINTAIASNTGSYTGYSFAVPVSIVEKVVTDLREFGKVQRAFIGVQIRNINQPLAEEEGLDVLEGAYVSGLTEGGAAGEAGIETGDLIRKVNGKPVKNVAELQEEVSQHRPGDQISVTLLRDGERKTVKVTLRNKEGTTELVKKEAEEDVGQKLGAKLTVPAQEKLRTLGIRSGVQVSDLQEGKFKKAGIKEGFIIVRMNHERVTEVSDITRILKEESEEGVLIEGVYPNGVRAYYGLGA